MTGCDCDNDTQSLERSTLWLLLFINGLMFLAELVAGWAGESTGLLADSLDMFADATVYGIALYAVGGSPITKINAAVASGWLQIVLGAGVFAEVIRRLMLGSEPASTLIIVVGVAALAANVTCLMVLAKHRKGEVHMRASWIFSTNDVIANIGVVTSGLLVAFLGSRIPDLAIGAIVSAFVVSGGCRILREARKEQAGLPDPD